MLSPGSTFGPIKRAKYFSEFIGTFFLILTIKMCGNDDGTPYAAFGIGFVLMVVIFQFGWISGAHFNPAVTTTLVVRGNLPSFPRSDKAQIAMYYVAQFLGAIIAGLLSGALGGRTACEMAPFIASDAVFEALLCEFFYTFLLCSAVINTGTLQDGNPYYGNCIGMSLFVSVLSIGSISGSCINPAVWVGLTLSASVCLNDDVQYEYFWVYFLAEFAAAIVVGLIYHWIILPFHKASKMELSDGRIDAGMELMQDNQSGGNAQTIDE